MWVDSSYYPRLHYLAAFGAGVPVYGASELVAAVRTAQAEVAKTTIWFIADDEAELAKKSVAATVPCQSIVGAMLKSNNLLLLQALFHVRRGYKVPIVILYVITGLELARVCIDQ